MQFCYSVMIFFQGYRVYNTWMGDPIKLVLLEKVLQVTKRENLIAKAAQTGEYLMKNLLEVQKQHAGLVGRSRGRGTFIAFDVLQNKRESFIGKMLQKGTVIRNKPFGSFQVDMY